MHFCLTVNGRCKSNSYFNFDRFDQIWTRVKCLNECTLIPLFVWYFRHTFVPSPVCLHVKKLFYLSFDPYQNSPVHLSQRCRLVKMRLLPGYLMFSVKYQIDFLRQKAKELPATWVLTRPKRSWWKIHQKNLQIRFDPIFLSNT